MFSMTFTCGGDIRTLYIGRSPLEITIIVEIMIATALDLSEPRSLSVAQKGHILCNLLVDNSRGAYRDPRWNLCRVDRDVEKHISLAVARPSTRHGPRREGTHKRSGL